MGWPQWLTDKDNPLTAKVVVNRIWQKFFGAGALAENTGDYGNQGKMPESPGTAGLAGAIHFRESSWNIKQLNKMIVMSAPAPADTLVQARSRRRKAGEPRSYPRPLLPHDGRNDQRYCTAMANGLYGSTDRRPKAC